MLVGMSGASSRDANMSSPEEAPVPYSEGLWKHTSNGWVLPFRNHEEKYQMHTGNTVVFLHSDDRSCVDHIFLATSIDEENDEYTGLYIWRHSVEFFDELVSDLVEHGFSIQEQDEPHPADLVRYQENVAAKAGVFDDLVTMAMQGFDHEAAYFLGEE